MLFLLILTLTPFSVLTPLLCVVGSNALFVRTKAICRLRHSFALTIFFRPRCCSAQPGLCITVSTLSRRLPHIFGMILPSISSSWTVFFVRSWKVFCLDFTPPDRHRYLATFFTSPVSQMCPRGVPPVCKIDSCPSFLATDVFSLPVDLGSHQSK